MRCWVGQASDCLAVSTVSMETPAAAAMRCRGRPSFPINSDGPGSVGFFMPDEIRQGLIVSRGKPYDIRKDIGMPDNFRRRLRLALAHVDKTEAALARFLGISPQSLNGWKRPVLEHMQKACVFLDVSEPWLTRGGDPAPSWDSPKRDPQDPPSWAAEILREVRRIHARLDGISPGKSGDTTADESISAIMDPDEHPRSQAPSYPPPSRVPGGPPRGH